MPISQADPALKVVASELNLRSEPSADAGASTVIRVLHAGDSITQTGYAPRDPSWATVVAADGTNGFVKRMLLQQSNPGPISTPSADLITAFNSAIWKATQDYDSVTYKLGAKDPTAGQVDCSGWIAFINRLSFNAANAALGRQVFSPQTLQLFNTHSDHQVSIPGYNIKQIFSIENVSNIPWRSGMLIGINFSDYSWERGQGRVFEIDHIVQTMAGAGGQLFITQSSGGNGVNKKDLHTWLAGVENLRASNRLHVIDLLALARATAGAEAESAGQTLELPELDTSKTPAG